MRVMFASAVDATRCAIEIQRVMVERNAPIPEDRRIELSVMASTLPTSSSTRAVSGDAINTAARHAASLSAALRVAGVPE
jgi:adenylate cyclase